MLGGGGGRARQGGGCSSRDQTAFPPRAKAWRAGSEDHVGGRGGAVGRVLPSAQFRHDWLAAVFVPAPVDPVSFVGFCKNKSQKKEGHL